MSQIHIQRESRYADGARKYKIILDGAQIGSIPRDTEQSFSVEPGEHTLELTIDWCSSNIVEFTVEEGQDVFFLCGSNIQLGRLLQTLLYFTIWRKRYLFIEQKESGWK